MARSSSRRRHHSTGAPAGHHSTGSATSHSAGALACQHATTEGVEVGWEEDVRRRHRKRAVDERLAAWWVPGKAARRRSKVATPFKVLNTAVAVFLRPGRLLRARRRSSSGPRARVRSLMASPPPHGVQLRARPPPWRRYSSPRGRAGSGRHPLNG
ncbi:unnamed protein product [Miscanthus lutarioriparius]|uniref:Uncharacterized protein n=1 Tax=Miscanthus lutarioriparius TaxID=422564 RepID=A0A811MX32_9POAL|nr:unnamed protein product [Miscanthus lutarioriparius]